MQELKLRPARRAGRLYRHLIAPALGINVPPSLRLGRIIEVPAARLIIVDRPFDEWMAIVSLAKSKRSAIIAVNDGDEVLTEMLVSVIEVDGTRTDNMSWSLDVFGSLWLVPDYDAADQRAFAVTRAGLIYFDRSGTDIDRHLDCTSRAASAVRRAIAEDE